MMNIDTLWEYDDPAKSEAVFRAAMEEASGDDYLELLTQVARALALQDEFEAAHRLLDQAESQLADAGHRPRIRYLLERGRAFNSSGDGERARALFQTAWESAEAAAEEGLAVDAAHMVAITYAGTPEAGIWTRRGLEAAEGSQDPKAVSLVPALLNNHAWDLHDMGRFEEALPVFQRALDEWSARGQPNQIHIARWSVARCLRSLGRHAEAVSILRDLDAEREASGTPDPYVFDELAENLEALGDVEGSEAARRRSVDSRQSGEGG